MHIKAPLLCPLVVENNLVATSNKFPELNDQETYAAATMVQVQMCLVSRLPCQPFDKLPKHRKKCVIQA